MTLTLKTLEDRYFERMASSLGDKARMLPWIVGARVLDVGAGGGEFASAITATGRQVWALDAAPDSLSRLRARQEDDPRLHVLDGLADQVPLLVPDGLWFDTIVCSAVLHEVYSYGSSTGLTGFEAVIATLASLTSVLAPGGRLIVRDGVRPDRPLEAATVTVPDDELVEEYLRLSPHPELRLTRISPRNWAGTRHAVAEMMLTLTWGRESLPREALERYGLMTLDEFDQLLDPAWTPRERSVVVQPGYASALAGYHARDEHGVWFPNTNALWVFDRTSPSARR